MFDINKVFDNATREMAQYFVEHKYEDDYELERNIIILVQSTIKAYHQELVKALSDSGYSVESLKLPE